jgi:integration host factor subunit alpha
MTKADLVDRIKERMNLTRNESVDVLEMVFAIMKNTLEEGEILRISGFGNFVVKKKHDRRGRNPQTGETITIDARRVLTFKPSAMLKKAINRDGHAPDGL